MIFDAVWFALRLSAEIAVGCFLLWVFYLAVMSLQTARDLDKLTPWNRRFGYIVLGIGWVLDFFGNMVPASLLFAEVPQELTISARVKRLISGPDGFRKQRAIWVRDHFLKPFDPTGRHG